MFKCNIKAYTTSSWPHFTEGCLIIVCAGNTFPGESAVSSCKKETSQIKTNCVYFKARCREGVTILHCCVLTAINKNQTVLYDACALSCVHQFVSVFLPVILFKSPYTIKLIPSFVCEFHVIHRNSNT